MVCRISAFYVIAPPPGRLVRQPSATPMGIVRPLPKGPWWRLPLTVVVILFAILGTGLLQSPWPMLIAVVVIVVGELRGLRCPQCNRRLKQRRVPVDNGPAYKVFYECPHCAALWDGEMTFDPTRD